MMENIPFKYVGQDTWIQLANKLDFDTMMGNNWKMLAEKLGYEVEDILNIECRQTRHGRNTLKLFEDYVKKSGNSVTQLKKSLESMDRPDALDVLLEAIPEIERKYTAAMRNNNNRRIKIEPGENSCTFSSGRCSGNCGGPSVTNSGISQHHNISVCPSQYSHYNSQHCPDISPRSLHVTKELNTMPHSYQSYNSTATSIPHSSIHQQHTTSHEFMTSYTSSSLPDESMEVNIDMADQYLQDNIQMDNESESNSRHWPPDEKAALPPTIFNATNYHPSLSRVPPLLNYNDMHVGNEEVVETSERMPVHPSAPFGRQVSEEMNTNQPLVDPKGIPAPTNANLGLNLHVRPKERQQAPIDKKKFCSPSPTTPGNPLAKLQQFTNSETYMPNEEYNSMMAAKNREEMLNNRSNLEEVQCRLRGGNDQGHRDPQTEEDYRMIFNFNAGLRNHRAMMEQQQHVQNHRVMKDKAGVNKEIPKTFPRAKSMMHCTSAVGGAQGNQTAECVSGLTKSMSMPDDMKPVEFQRKNFWHIKVFVTYSNDSKRHIQRVLNLCRCLEKNGFTCCMDIYDHKMMDSKNKLGWVNQRFSEADFVLVCVSPNYLTEATCMVENNESALHTSYIYQLMDSEIQNGSAELETRFIPIMFDGSRPEDIPKVMHHRLSYHWPKQYRDLLWYLTKPATRTKTKANNYVEQCPRSPKSPNIPT